MYLTRVYKHIYRPLFLPDKSACRIPVADSLSLTLPDSQFYPKRWFASPHSYSPQTLENTLLAASRDLLSFVSLRSPPFYRRLQSRGGSFDAGITTHAVPLTSLCPERRFRNLQIGLVCLDLDLRPLRGTRPRTILSLPVTTTDMVF